MQLEDKLGSKRHCGGDAFPSYSTVVWYARGTYKRDSEKRVGLNLAWLEQASRTDSTKLRSSILVASCASGKTRDVDPRSSGTGSGGGNSGAYGLLGAGLLSTATLVSRFLQPREQVAPSPLLCLNLGKDSTIETCEIRGPGKTRHLALFETVGKRRWECLDNSTLVPITNIMQATFFEPWLICRPERLCRHSPFQPVGNTNEIPTFVPETWIATNKTAQS